MNQDLIALERALLRLDGPDAAEFLNGLLTQSTTDMEIGACRYGALLTPQGKVIADMMIWRMAGERFYLDLSPPAAETVARRLSIYRLRARVEITPAGPYMGVAAMLGAGEPPDQALMIQPDPRFADGALGARMLTFQAQADGAAADYEAARLRLGAPDLSRDAAPEEVFGLEALLEELNGVDFHKGCFVGQENVSRMKRRATTRKKFCPIAFEGPALAYGTPVHAGAVEIGSVRTGTTGRALALIRLDRALEALDKGESLSVGGAPARLDPPSWLILPSDRGEG